MDCKHERLRTVGYRVFCCSCGVELPLEFLTGKGRTEEPPGEEKAAKAPARKKPARKLNQVEPR